MPSLFRAALAATLSLAVALPIALKPALSAGARAGSITGRALGSDHKVGLGPIVSSANGGQIFGFATNANGTDGILAEANLQGSNVIAAVETFNQKTGKIVKVVAMTNTMDDFVADGIVANDVGLVTHEAVTGNKVVRSYPLLNPVTSNKFTSMWKSPIEDLGIEQVADNQTTTTSVLFVTELANQDIPDLIVTDLGKNKIDKVIPIDPNQFGLAMAPQFAQDTIHDQAVFATSPSGGAAGGPPPKVGFISLKTGKMSEFSGVQCPGSVGCGYANGVAYDSKTGIACTDTELDGGVEFYDLAKQTGFHEFLPGNFGQLTSGAFIANDPIHKLFLIAQPVSSTAQSGSSVQVFDEHGSLVESINGFNFSNASSVIFARISLHPADRTGYVNGPGINQLQQFSY